MKEPAGRGKKPADERKRRLALALRENLRRRKAQQRARTEPQESPSEKPPETGGNPQSC